MDRWPEEAVGVPGNQNNLFRVQVRSVEFCCHHHPPLEDLQCLHPSFLLPLELVRVRR